MVTYNGTIRGKIHSDGATLWAALADFVLVKDEHAAFFNDIIFLVVKTDRVWAKTTLKTRACSDASYETGALVLVKLAFVME